MARDFDLFGNPVPANRGKAGRNEHAPDAAIAKKIRGMLVSRYPLSRIAEEVGLSVPTLRKHYFSNRNISIQAARAMAREEQRAKLMLRLDEQVDAGNVSAMKEMKKILDEEDLRDLAAAAQGATHGGPRKERALPKGKKEELTARASDLLESDPLLRPGLPN